MTIEGQIKDEKLQYDINREAAKISALSSGKIDKYEYLTGEDPLTVLNEIKNDEMTLEEAKNYQKDYLGYLKNIRKGNKNV